MKLSLIRYFENVILRTFFEWKLSFYVLFKCYLLSFNTLIKSCSWRNCNLKIEMSSLSLNVLMCVTVVIIAVMIVRCLDMIWAPGSVFPHTNKVFDGSIHFQVPYECTLHAYVMGNSSSSSSSAPKHSCQVVIVGGGYAGVKLAIDLDSYCKVVLIDPKDAFHHNMAGLRCIVEPAFVNKTLIPYEGVLKHGSFVKNRVVSCNISRKAVTLASSEEISYDYLVFACGSSVPFPGKVYLSMLVYNCKAPDARMCIVFIWQIIFNLKIKVRDLYWLKYLLPCFLFKTIDTILISNVIKKCGWYVEILDTGKFWIDRFQACLSSNKGILINPILLQFVLNDN